MGIIQDAQKKVTPNCRYGHGDLERLKLKNEEGQSRGTIISTYLEIENMGSAMMDGRGYSVSVFRCQTCGYIELFDDGDYNG